MLLTVVYLENVVLVLILLLVRVLIVCMGWRIEIIHESQF